MYFQSSLDFYNNFFSLRISVMIKKLHHQKLYYQKNC